MASTSATQKYDLPQKGAFSVAQGGAALAGVTFDNNILSMFAQLGLVLSADSTVNGPPAVRTIQWLLKPTGATFTAQIGGVAPGGAASATPAAITGLTITGRGLNFAEPPIFSFTPAGGDAPSRKAQATAKLRVNSANVITGGSGYGASATAVAVGGLGAGGVAATFTVTVVAGVVTAVNMATPGSGYVGLPLIVITGASPGTGAVAIAAMEIDTVTIIDGGAGYFSVPLVVTTGGFAYRFPDSTRFNFRNLLTVFFQNALGSPVFAEATILA
jgi:hypothetical protein